MIECEGLLKERIISSELIRNDVAERHDIVSITTLLRDTLIEELGERWLKKCRSATLRLSKVCIWWGEFDIKWKDNIIITIKYKISFKFLWIIIKWIKNKERE